MDDCKSKSTIIHFIINIFSRLEIKMKSDTTVYKPTQLHVNASFTNSICHFQYTCKQNRSMYASRVIPNCSNYYCQIATLITVSTTVNKMFRKEKPLIHNKGY